MPRPQTTHDITVKVITLFTAVKVIFTAGQNNSFYNFVPDGQEFTAVKRSDRCLTGIAAKRISI